MPLSQFFYTVLFFCLGICRSGTLHGTLSRSLSTSLQVTTLAGSGSTGFQDGPATSSSFNNPRSIAVAVDESYLLIIDSGNHAIRKYNISTRVVSTLAGGVVGYFDDTGTNAKFNGPAVVCIHHTGLFAWITDSNNHRLRELSLDINIVTTVAGSGAALSIDGHGLNAAFNNPFGLAMSPDGDFALVSEFNGHRVRRIMLATSEVTTLAGSTVGYLDGAGTNAMFNSPSFMAIPKQGDFALVADNNNVIRRVVLASGVVSTYCGYTTFAGNSDGACGNAATFSSPRGVAFSSDALYVIISDRGNDILRKIDTRTMLVSAYAGSGFSGFADGPAATAQFNDPFGGIFGTNDVIYVADSLNNRIRLVAEIAAPPPTNSPTLSPTIDFRVVTTLAGSTQGFADGAGSSALFSDPNYVTLAPDNAYLLITDSSSHAIRLYSRSTGAVTTIAGGSALGGYVDASGTNARFSNPSCVAIHPSGTYALIGDYSNYRIRKMMAGTFVVTTVVGNGASSDIDGIGTSATIYGPACITISPDGTYAIVCSHEGHKIRKLIIASWALSTIAGNSLGYLDATGTSARFNTPGFVALSPDAAFALIAENNNVIRHISLSSNVVTTYCGYTTAAGFINGGCSLAQFNTPRGIAISSDNSYILIADQENHAIRKITTASMTVTTYSGGTFGFMDGSLSSARFRNPYGIALLADGSAAFIGDRFNYRVRQVWSVNVPTALPTSAPTKPPTAIPTFAPTVQPTLAPTFVPTVLPTSAPTFVPTVLPTSAPTFVPTVLPTSAPTFVPTVLPTSAPTFVPTVLPTSAPTFVPTVLPTSAPTFVPTAPPTSAPTFVPTVLPTSAPTFVPTALPTSAPTFVPTVLPTSAPTFVPTVLPTSAPTFVATAPPTSAPTLSPTFLPSTSPTKAPSFAPTAQFRVVTTAGGSTAGFSDGVGTLAQFDLPSDVALSVDNTYVLIVDQGNHAIRKYTRSSGNVVTVAGGSTEGAFSDAVGVAARFNNPFALAMHPSGDFVLISEYSSNNRIRLMATDTFHVTTVAGNGAATNTDGVGTSATIKSPGGIAISPDGSFALICSLDGNVIRKLVIATWTLSTIAGTNNDGYVDATGTSARFKVPAFVAISSDATFALITENNRVVRRIDLATNAVTTYCGTGSSGLLNGLCSNAKFSHLRGIAISPDGLYVLVADHLNNIIRRIDTVTMTVSTYAGDGVERFQDGPLTSSSFFRPQGVAILADGSAAFVGDWQNNRLRHIWLMTVPTAQPTNMPTPHPTSSPTLIPSSHPTFVPTSSPTHVPNCPPTNIPSTIPSNIPSSISSTFPSSTPTNTPSSYPSSVPTSVPSFLPSGVPSSLPSGVPSNVPSSFPTSDPTTSIPSAAPSRAPSTIPTADPTCIPSNVPSSLPTGTPSSIPSSVPTFMPSHEPSTVPTSIPSPCSVPTSIPSLMPSALPSRVPSPFPTSIPSLMPSALPSRVPSPFPSFVPSSIPSSTPSATPTRVPSVHPISVPSNAPSSIPSLTNISISPVFPTCPTHNPSSSFPTSDPTTSIPSAVPSRAPSTIPTADPTCIPSNVPSSLPTGTPSSVPSSVPSFMPSHEPSTVPTSIPSPCSVPTSIPSLIPSSSPSSKISRIPTTTLTNVPSSSSSCSSSGPTSIPSIIPSSLPSFIPTVTPTCFPTSTSSSFPSSYPLLTASEVPTCAPTVAPSIRPSTVAPTSSATLIDVDMQDQKNGAFAVYGKEGTSLGYSVSALGDVNGDGVDDMLIGAPYSIVTTLEAYVIFGRAGGVPDIYLSNFNYKQGFIIYSRHPNDALGHAASGLGDINGDGLNDFIISAPYTDNSKGAAYVIYGKLGYREHLYLASFAENDGFIVSGYLVNGKTGFSVSGVGDVNGDGISDWVLSMPFVNSNTGVTYLVFGKNGATYRNISLSSWTTDMGVIFYGSMPKCQSGFLAISVGDMNGDGLLDFAIGEPLALSNYVGLVRVIFGCADNCFGESIHLANLGNRGFSITGSGLFARIGAVMSSAGDINYDGRDDLILGAPFLHNKRGVIYVIYGKEFAVNVDLGNLQSSQGYMIHGSDASHFGMSVAGGLDFNHDGLLDMVIGNPTSASKRKAVAILGSRRFGALDFMTPRDGFYMTTTDRDAAGNVVRHVGDINRDGYVDYAVSAYDDSTGGQKAGAVYIVYDLYSSDVMLTHSPVVSPTSHPSVAPTKFPTLIPTLRPTIAPSPVPTLKPSPLPSSKPTYTPSKAPSITAYPTSAPTHVPSVTPTLRPTITPSSMPTQRPTLSPTRMPTAVPSSLPSSSEPSNVPSASPSFAPNLSQRPTSPSPRPTPRPTRAPTFRPSSFPTTSPSVNPTPSPYWTPTPLPTRIPTVHPTAKPSKQPTPSPTILPSRMPTQRPTMKDGYSEVDLTMCGVYHGIGVNERVTIKVPSGCNVVLFGVNGSDIYVFTPSTGSSFTLLNFDLQKDIIDLSFFPTILEWKKINMTAGSVLIHLPHQMTITILHHSPMNMTRSHFILYNRTSNAKMIFGAFMLTIFSVFSCIVVLMFCDMTSSILDCDEICDAASSDENIKPRKRNNRATIISAFISNTEFTTNTTATIPVLIEDSESNIVDATSFHVDTLSDIENLLDEISSSSLSISDVNSDDNDNVSLLSDDSVSRRSSSSEDLFDISSVSDDVL